MLKRAERKMRFSEFYYNSYYAFMKKREKREKNR